MQSADTRLFQFVSDAWADHHPLVLNAPCERTLTYEPRALEFLEHIAGYHLVRSFITRCRSQTERLAGKDEQTLARTAFTGTSSHNLTRMLT